VGTPWPPSIAAFHDLSDERPKGSMERAKLPKISEASEAICELRHTSAEILMLANVGQHPSYHNFVVTRVEIRWNTHRLMR
jgi:hypothetical protein